MGQWMDGFLEKLAANRRENEEAGGPEALALQRKLGKLTARERIAHLVRDLERHLAHRGEPFGVPHAAMDRIQRASPIVKVSRQRPNSLTKSKDCCAEPGCRPPLRTEHTDEAW